VGYSWGSLSECAVVTRKVRKRYEEKVYEYGGYDDSRNICGISVGK